ncbi:MAG: UDP-3-O-(3-hydroxymyristoyl)glucosamine N-acyltransferase [candidate division WOR-3 bacterium]
MGNREENLRQLIYLHPEAKLGKGVKIYPFVYVGEEVEIGEASVIYPYTVLLKRTKIGKRVLIGPGALIGFEGFGYEKVGGEYRRIPHEGWVVIEDDCEIGANVTIALAKKGETRIGKGTKIDALVHIGHNVKIGKNCLIVAQVGIGGSAEIGDNVILAGQVGIKDHVKVGDNSIVYAKSALFKSCPKGARYFGIPARPYGKVLRAWAKIYQTTD